MGNVAQRLDAVVVGVGQALGYYSHGGLRYQIADAGPHIAHTCTTRWDLPVLHARTA